MIAQRVFPKSQTNCTALTEQGPAAGRFGGGRFAEAAVVVTGASHGIGEHVARCFASEGARLVLAARRQPELEAVAERCRILGAEVICVVTDIGDEAQCAKLIDAAQAAFGRIDVLVNNAGLGMWARVDEVTDFSVFERVMRVNYFGALWCTAYALPHLKKTRGRIVAVSSVAGRTGVPLRSGYVASNHALAGFFDSLRIELAGTGVTVTLVNPAWVSTGAQERNLAADGSAHGRTPSGIAKAMTPEACARIIVDAAANRRREVVVSARAKLALWLRMLVPALVDDLTARAMTREG
jgi:short-subunit dehydrogenase